VVVRIELAIALTLEISKPLRLRCKKRIANLKGGLG
jgi:hypothetical protein